MRICILSCILAFVVYGCVELYEPEVGEYDSTLVVDGLFSNSDDSSVVVLSRSFAYSTDEVIFVQGANVVIEDDAGGMTQLLEGLPGVYKTDPSLFKGEIGKRYRLLINTPDGNQFESDWESMKAAPAIGDINFVLEERIPDDSDEPPIPGVQFYLNTADAEGNTRFYRWEFVETYQYGLRHSPQIRVEFGDPPLQGMDEIFYISFDESEGYRCWKTLPSRSILIASTNNLDRDEVVDFPLHYVDNRTPRLVFRYSLLTKQYAISEDYYEHLKALEEINETTGSLFDPIPNEVFGNIKSSDNQDIPVLGYFSVAGVSEKRIFVDREDLPVGFRSPSGPDCEVDSIGIDFQELYNRVRNGRLVLYEHFFAEPPRDPVGYLLSRPPCTSCAANDATNTQPGFW